MKAKGNKKDAIRMIERCVLLSKRVSEIRMRNIRINLKVKLPYE